MSTLDDSAPQPAAPSDAAAPPLEHPGTVLRRAREARGQALSALSIQLKIPERRLQAFEEGRWAEVGDRTFVRALAQSLCRQFEVDAGLVLGLLPAMDAGPKEAPNRGTLPNGAVVGLRSNRRFGGSSTDFSSVPEWARRPSVWAGGALVAGAIVLAFAPSSWWGSVKPAAPEPKVLTQVMDGTPASPVAAAPAVVAPTPAAPALGASAPAVLGAPSLASTSATAAVAPASTSAGSKAAGGAVTAGAPAAAVPSAAPSTVSAPVTISGSGEGGLRMKVSQPSWIQVNDARGQALVSRLVGAGEVVEVDGRRPLKVRVGNVSGTEVQWRGQRVDLSAQQRNNVAQVELD